MKVKLREIKIKEERYRDDFGDIDALAVDIQRHGLYHPIVVAGLEPPEGEFLYILVAGERRYRAHERLGLGEIEVKLLKDADELLQREIEIEENLQRKDFTWQEEIRAKRDINEVKRKLYGQAIKGHGGGWSIKDTAKSLGESIGGVSQDIRLAEALEEFPELLKETNKGAAWKRYLRMKERALRSEVAKRVEIDTTVECLRNVDCLVGMKEMKDESVHLILADPPYGINLDKTMKGVKEIWDEEGVYKDHPFDVKNMLEKVVKECYRVLTANSHMYLFFGMQHYSEVRRMVEEAGFGVNPMPCIWYKTGGMGTGMGPRVYSNNWEPFFFLYKGDRDLRKSGYSNVFMEPRVPPQKKVHPAEKPTSLLRKLIEMSSEPGEVVLDPFAGSASTLVAAYECSRVPMGFEVGKEHYEAAALRLKGVMERG